jgi:exodeoxyribonuclease V beta subunit
MPGGARIGTLIHAVLEHTDFTAPELERAVRASLVEQTAWSATAIGSTDPVVDGLLAAIETPLGPVAGGRRLRDIPSRDRLNELGFELPLVGGDEPAGEVLLGALADLLDAHLRPGDPLVGYPDRLREVSEQRLRGYLTGSLDAVLRFPGGDEGPVSYAVVDYKTNWLGVGGGGITAWDYRPAALAVAMQHAHYPLQALFYVVALHRYLRWRVRSYDPDVQLAGVLYLFVRGMVGPVTASGGAEPCGVFSWRPPSALVVAASELLDRGAGGRRG